MNENESVDVESAYGSENSKFIIKEDTFAIEETTPKRLTRCQWLKYKLRKYIILEAVFFITLIYLLITGYRISSRNKEKQEMMLRITSQLRSIQKPSRKDFMDNVWKEIMKDYMKENAEETSKNTFEMLESKEDLKEHRVKPVVQLKQNQSIINSTEKLEKTYARPTIPTVPTNSTFKQFNAASLIASSTIDKSLSEK